MWNGKKDAPAVKMRYYTRVEGRMMMFVVCACGVALTFNVRERARVGATAPEDVWHGERPTPMTGEEIRDAVSGLIPSRQMVALHRQLLEQEKRRNDGRRPGKERRGKS